MNEQSYDFGFRFVENLNFSDQTSLPLGIYKSRSDLSESISSHLQHLSKLSQSHLAASVIKLRIHRIICYVLETMMGQYRKRQMTKDRYIPIESDDSPVIGLPAAH